ncbi:MAG: hypothetical protein DVS81_02710 [Candidatus Accumulibacter meliphilus]|jgi:hypothetical protein|uniref:Uncharacterized protein n=1 Tax=Candidatus Accumulibacter meliphilus TaxID=2211374 RepID=A0A369XUS7_9PROT|nr:MAG: hypothetical protein DVS81_02710 [Candidatus Accumulibacter meliphilus]
MLNHLENLLADAVHLALPANPRPTTGPMQPPSPDDAPALNIAATRLRPTRKSDADGQDKRAPVDLPQRLTLTGDSETVKWAFPKHTGKNIIEIELTPGRLARRGDDYLITEAPEDDDPQYEEETQPKEDANKKQDTLEFRQAPVGPFTVLSRSGTPTAGYQERSPCRITIEINAWAAQTSAADALMTPALAAALTALTGIDRLELVRIELTQPAGTLFNVRLLDPRVELTAIERLSLPGESRLIHSFATLSLSAESEMTLTLGRATPPSNKIKAVVIDRSKVEESSDGG